MALRPGPSFHFFQLHEIQFIMVALRCNTGLLDRYNSHFSLMIVTYVYRAISSRNKSSLVVRLTTKYLSISVIYNFLITKIIRKCAVATHKYFAFYLPV